MGDLWVAQEYECSFVSREGLVYPSFGECLVEMDTLPIGRRLGGIDFGWRNPFAAIWGMVDEDDVLWILGEHYASETPIHEHALILQQQPGVLWLADPAGRSEIESLRAAGLKVRSADNNIRHGIAAVNARIRTGRLKVWQSRCPELIRESRLYHYPRVEEVDARTREIPIDSDNHALAALRYLISKLDAGFLARLRQREHSPNRQDKAKRLAGPEYRDEQLWTTLF